MIASLDHVVLRAPFGEAAVAAYETLLGRRAESSRFQLGNVGLAIENEATTAHLASMAFATESLDKAEHLLQRRNVQTTRAGYGLALDPAATHGVPIALIERKDRPVMSDLTGADEAAAIAGLDHIVIRTPNPERAVAFYGGRLGLDLRLDRSNPQWGTRLLFFRCGDLVVEIAHDLGKGVSAGPDQLWGLSWRVPDIARAHARLQKSGVEVSSPRDGRRPGTQVFSVLSHTANVPTIVIGGLGRW
ncbi:Catechol 2,3-dioxygenase [Enhydrobacter aerosaccus]|uniref:Catechol 2,3-dioxygenase n=1 Tax=Enhydrobacter aerosaccus TaxID=225324 RepID=A0A1T4RYD4_9HYPH|nr:VOC family protein [Enhydrobacter aerosaccus]SKA21024.1 Catechol 2,3-dioxygenase [Enhydrobacter aerosaccus]